MTVLTDRELRILEHAFELLYDREMDSYEQFYDCDDAEYLVKQDTLGEYGFFEYLRQRWFEDLKTLQDKINAALK